MLSFRAFLAELKEELSSPELDLSTLDRLRAKYLGRNGLVNKSFDSISPDEKKAVGPEFNQTKKHIEDLLEDKRLRLLEQSDTAEFFDVTRSGTSFPKGSLHLVTYAVEEITKIFERIGFIRMSYPEVEWEYNDFEALNMPKGHPARDDFETFFVEAEEDPQLGKMILSPHTSSGQIREMLRVKTPPMRMINIAKCYRPNWDVSHVPMFHQFEGFVIDKDINITHLKGTINYFAKEFFGEKREIRLRPYHFQFTEPSFEVDITCGVCGGTGFLSSPSSRGSQKGSHLGENDNKIKCKLCKSGWLELGGSGMIHPNVLRAGSIDPAVYSGWAFGIGVERTFMMKEGLKLDDIRTLYSGDIRFLQQF
ncbi:phenylalanine--tRNA ligase subunit alpha [Candidatus Roizmanbacteria bacterium]|nr:phenylalanine--tRNA ligase subunit alpha [Candidatus Roizmanbacteria bacterium]